MQAELLTEREVAKIIGRSVFTLRNDRRNPAAVNLPFVKVGRSVRYRRSDVEAFLAGLVTVGGEKAE